ncbi:MAG: hypothetical protein QXX64_04535 [Nitrososphaera sp.]|uniref:Uncharacterized protein n=1 Tax=Nitrososphaera gargensis (strain Ga9.2) TaxID=1237085 RepID=K0ILF8_NITGG|nr:hypothetical protein [Candidatus Nitrososphaera gargensis]AFU60388.1 hypothetical protein Ngar_c34740 [Candidatus Nitrososphaera gargensis Ga9.2]
MPVFQLSALIDALEEQGFSCRVGSMELDVHPMKRPYFERWLSNRDGFLRMASGSVDFIGIEDVVRMGPFYNVYCLVENDFIVDTDDNAHKLLDAAPYFQLHNGKVTSMGWSGGVIANMLAKDTALSEEFACNIMKEEVKMITVKAANYCCIIETRAWEPVGLASAFATIDRIAHNIRRLVKTIHLGEYIDK